MSGLRPGSGFDSTPDDELDPDDVPSTHLDDDAYDEFVQDTFGAGGRLRGDPPVGWIVLAIVVVLLLLVTLLM